MIKYTHTHIRKHACASKCIKTQMQVNADDALQARSLEEHLPDDGARKPRRIEALHLDEASALGRTQTLQSVLAHCTQQRKKGDGLARRQSERDAAPCGQGQATKGGEGYAQLFAEKP